MPRTALLLALPKARLPRRYTSRRKVGREAGAKCSQQTDDIADGVEPARGELIPDKAGKADGQEADDDAQPDLIAGESARLSATCAEVEGKDTYEEVDGQPYREDKVCIIRVHEFAPLVDVSWTAPHHATHVDSIHFQSEEITAVVRTSANRQCDDGTLPH